MFYTMGEVSEMFDVSSSLIRYWEKQFSVIKPVRNKKGNRQFTPKDIENFKLIYHLVKERGMTLEGAKKSIKANGVVPINREVELMDRLLNIKSLLLEVREVLKEDGDTSEEDIRSEEQFDMLSEEDDELVIVDNRPRQRRRVVQDSSEEKELFAFYEQKLF
ncbi:MAG: MerR family transcriptional regulator [Rikenellaceae bacterium]